MSRDRTSLRYKFREVGGIKSIFGRSGLDFYLALGVSIAYTIIILRTPIGNALLNDPLFFQVIVGIIAFHIAGIKLILNWREKVRSNNEFNLILEENNLLARVDFHFDYTIVVTIISLIIWLAYGIFTHGYTNDYFDNTNPNIISYLTMAFAIPLGTLVYLASNIYYSWEAKNKYTDCELKYKRISKQK